MRIKGTFPVRWAAQDGSGSPGPASKSIYKCSFDQPSTPTGSSPQGSGNLDWRDDVYKQDDIQIQQQGDWYKGDDGYYYAPAIGASQETVQTLTFVTTAANQKIYLRGKCSTSYYAYMYIGNVDAVSPKTNYMRQMRGTNQDTGDLEITVATAGVHFICIVYTRGYAYSSDLYAKFACGKLPIWQSNAKTYNSAGTITAWTTPFKVTADEAEQEAQTRSNILLQTAFLASRLDKWVTRNGSTTEGMDGRNAFTGTPDMTKDFTELLAQNVSDPNGNKPLLANTWYTLSFWAKAAPYVLLTKNTTSYAYGFATETCYLQAGVECKLTIGGYISSAASSAGKYLRVYVYNSDWSFARYADINTTSSTEASVTFTPPTTGEYKITAYAYSSGATSAQTVTLQYYKLNRGMRLMTYLYPTAGTQSTYTCIDTAAGHVKDGQRVSTTNTDNNVEWQLTEVWTRHTLSFKTNSLSSTVLSSIQLLLFRMHQSSNGVWVCMPKLEQGTIATAYCTNDDDVADLAADETGFPNDRGVYVSAPSEAYVWNETRRDYVAYEVGGEWKRYFVKQKGMSVPNGYAPAAGGNTYWEEGSRINTLLVNTIVGANASLTFAKTNRLLVTKADGTTVAAGLGGAKGGDNDYPFWIGATYENRANAPFRVTLLGKMYASGCVISGDSTFEGTLKAVKGTFKTLQAVNDSGVVKAAIGFSDSEGKLYFEGDMQHQGYDSTNSRSYRFYTSDLWCRGTFGALRRATMVVYGSTARVYTKGIGNNYISISLESATSSNNEQYYKIPCYSPRYATYSDTSGFPVDTLIFNISGSTTYRYALVMNDTQRVLVINGNDKQNNVNIYQNGNKIEWSGGEIAFVVQLPVENINPQPASNLLGRGLIIGAFRDNNW